MLFETAARLALVESLLPTAALGAGTGFPTLAGRNVFDSRRVALDDLDDDGDNRTAVMSIYSGEAESSRAGAASAVDDRTARVVLEIIVELAMRFSANDQVFADADVANDAEAEIMLSALVAQIRRVIETGPTGAIFRKVTKGSVARFQSVPDVMPETGIRMARRFVTIEVDMRDDDHAPTGGLPEPLATLNGLLPANSYAKQQLTDLAAQFGALPSDPLTSITVAVAGGELPIGGVTFNQGG